VKHRSPSEVERALDAYRSLIDRYHDTLDLMSDRGREALNEHVRDAEAYVAVLDALEPPPSRLLDVGSGVGLPGIVIAAHLEDLPVELVERRARRGAFLRMAAAAVGGDVQVRIGDVAQLAGPPVDVVTAQAVGSLWRVYDLTCRRHATDVVLLTRKGPAWREEYEELAAKTGLTPHVVAEVALPERGTLVAVQMQGGATCPSSG